jgi:exopolysaccharide biosynthesis protein
MLTKETAEKAIKNGMRDAMEFGPFLIVNGKNSEIKGNGGWGIAPRTAIAQRKDGIVLFLVIDGRSKNSLGATMNDLIKVFNKYKAYNAANLDGGGSSTLVVNNEVINNPKGYNYSGERYLPNAWILK